jgi:hypothetical protein
MAKRKVQKDKQRSTKNTHTIKKGMRKGEMWGWCVAVL